MTIFSGIPAIIGVASQTVNIERATTAEDDLGGRTEHWIVFKSDLAAWVQPASTRTIEQYAARDIEITHRAYFSSDPSVELGDRIVFDSRYFLVMGIRNFGEVGKLWRIDCRETR